MTDKFDDFGGGILAVVLPLIAVWVLAVVFCVALLSGQRILAGWQLWYFGLGAAVTTRQGLGDGVWVALLSGYEREEVMV